MCEIAIPDTAHERSVRVRSAQNERPSRLQRRAHCVKRLQHLRSGQMLEDVDRNDRVEFLNSPIEKLQRIRFDDFSRRTAPREGYLLSADIHSNHVSVAHLAQDFEQDSVATA